MYLLRKYELQIENTVRVDNPVVVPLNPTVTATTTVYEPITDYKMTANLRVAPNAQKTRCIINLYNIGEDNIELLSNNVEQQVTLRAGYEYNGKPDTRDGILPTIYVGQIIGVETNKTSTDVITTLYCSSGWGLAKSQISNKVVFNGWTPEDECRMIAEESGMDFRWSVPPDVDLPIVKKDYTVDSNADTALDNITRKSGFTYHLENGAIVITKAGERTVGTLYEIPRERVKGQPKVKRDYFSTGASEESNKAHVRIETFMFSEVRIGDIVRVWIPDGRGSEQQKTFTINALEYKMDSMDGAPWDCIMEGYLED